MQAEPRPVSLKLRTLSGSCSNPGVHQLDTRRFAGIFPFDILEVDYSGATQEECDDDFVSPSRLRLPSKHDDNTFISQVCVASVADIDERPLSEDSCYRVVHRRDHATEHASTEINESLVQIPDDQRSTCTVATSVDSQSAMDMMWRPKLKIHMCLTDQMGLVQAKSQAIAMMYDAGLKPTNNIRCRRRDCADILLGVEALKYHLHIHNIADAAAKCNDAPPPPCEPTPIHSIWCSKRDHSRPKSSFGTQHKHSMTYFPSRNISVGSLLPSHVSLRESSPEVQHVPSFTTVAKSLVSGHTPSNSTVTMLQSYNNETFCTATSTLSRSRRGSSVTAGNTAIAMCLSPPSSPDTYGRFAYTPHANLPVPLVLNPAADGDYDNYTITSSESAHKVPEKLPGSRSSMRALSPTRALNPIRNGIRRVLSIGYSVDSSE